MIYSTRLRSMAAAVRRLEAAAGFGQRYCAYCRYTLRRSWPDSKRPGRDANEMVKAKCEFCGSEYAVSLAQFPEEDRDAYRLYYSFTIEDQYRNPRAHALKLWVKHRSKTSQRRPRVISRGKKSRHARALEVLREEARKQITQKHKRLAAEYGETPFPEHLHLVETIESEMLGGRRTEEYVGGLMELEAREQDLAVCAELEVIIWGQKRPGTVSALEGIRSEIEELIRTTLEENERRREEHKRKDMDFLNNNRKLCGLPPLPYDYYDKK